jgi:phage terminase large subunit-like protein
MRTRSQLVAPRGVQVPRVRLASKVRANDWEDVADLAKAYGLILDPWQENVLQASMGVRTDGHWATPTIGLSVPRQNGKGGILEARELAGLLLFGEKTIIHSAHEQKTARIGFDRILHYFENYDDLRKKVLGKPMSALGRENIKLRNGASLHFPARSKGAIRGFSIDCLILDEGQILGDPAWEAIKPTISARPNVQTWVVGTPPTPFDDGAVFTRMRQRGIEGKDHRLCWCEWSAPDDADLDDREAWAMANPALGYRITEEVIADERRELSDTGFKRERLGMWDPDPLDLAPVISSADWQQLVLPDDQVPKGKPTRYALALSPNRIASIAVAIPGDDVAFLDLAELSRVDDSRKIIEWIVKRCGRRTPVMIDSRDPAAAFINELRARGVKVNATTQSDAAKACTNFLTAVGEKRIHHVDQPAIGTALRIARKKLIGKAGLWEWDLDDPTAELAALRAITLAHYGLSFDKKRTGTGRRSTGNRRAVSL